MVSATLPGFDSVIGSAAAAVPIVVPGNASGFGFSVAWGAVPVPLKVEVCGEPVALSERERVAPKLIADAGVNVT
jgi:hypothetical protein